VIAEARARGAAPRADLPAGRTPRALRLAGTAGPWAAGGALVAAVLSSACCWLPLILVAFGASAAGVAAAFEAYRPYMLVAAAVLLASGFHVVYFRKERCEPGHACAVPNPRRARFQRIALWSASALVGAFALFPSYVGVLLGAGSGLATAPAPGVEARAVDLRIEGMTCAGCASGLRARLSSVPGVLAAEADYESGRATVQLAPAAELDLVLAAVEGLGFRGRVAGASE
jgi:copper chaperone CopZ